MSFSASSCNVLTTLTPAAVFRGRQSLSSSAASLAHLSSAAATAQCFSANAAEYWQASFGSRCLMMASGGTLAGCPSAKAHEDAVMRGLRVAII